MYGEGAADFVGLCGKEGLVRCGGLGLYNISSHPNPARLDLRSTKQHTKTKRVVFKYVVKFSSTDKAT